MQQYLNFYQFCYCKHFKWPSISHRSCVTLRHSNVFAGQSPTFPTILPIKTCLYLQNILLGCGSKERPRETVSESSRKKALVSSHRMLARSQRSVKFARDYRLFTTDGA